MSWIILGNGKPFDFTEATMPNVTPEVIAHSLSMQCRYAGHTPRFYSVAEHCLHMAMEVGANREMAFAALMHDAHECVVQDIVRPSKTDAFRVFERRVEALFEAHFGYRMTDGVKRLDSAMLASEAVTFFGPEVVDSWALPEPPLFGRRWKANFLTPDVAKRDWLLAYQEFRP